MSAPTSGWRACSASTCARLLVIVLAARLQVKLPAVAADGHLHDLGGAFVDRGDAHVAADLLHHVFVGVAVAAQRLDTGVGRGVAGFGGHVLGDCAFGVQAAFAGVDALGRLFDKGAAGFQARDVAARSACACIPAFPRAARRPECAWWSTESRDRAPPIPRPVQTPPPSGACSRTPPAPGSAPGLPRRRPAGRHRRKHR